MRAALVSAYGSDPDSIISVVDDYSKEPTTQKEGDLLIEVLACSIAYGDVHLLSGRVSMVISPPSWPYIPGMDVCGIVREVHRVGTRLPSHRFKIGDKVVANNGMTPVGGMAERMVVNAKSAALLPPSLTPLQGACCPVSAVTAVTAVQEKGKVKRGERVLVLGGSGGVGSIAVQIAKHLGASFVASTSTQVALLESIGVDDAIDYRTRRWWSEPEFSARPFDVIIDCVGGGQHYLKACKGKVLKSRREGGRFVAVVGDTPDPLTKTLPQLLSFAAGMMWKPLWTSLCPWVPAYVMPMSVSTTASISNVLKLVAEGKIKMVMDPSSPFPFTTQGVREAFRIQVNGRAHGKIVVEIAKEGEDRLRL